ncbi:MAG: dsbB 2 [Gammaproteobacteria bacterium]|jgi:disulfide bond formation protein DsbB|nr:dsbB 2 [Gammaproteobacteria bacterium]
MKNNKVFRCTYLAGFILTIVLLSSAVFLQVYKGMSPCPLCLLQRISLGTLSLIFFIGIILNLRTWGNLFLNFFGLVAEICGILLASRQVWLQISPPVTSGECGASLSSIFHLLSFREAIKQVWLGGMECSQTGLEFLHLSLAAWSLIGFAILLLLSILQLIRVATD